MSIKGFDHEISPTVTVRKNKDGEFVQVWNLPFKTQGRKLLLSYLRNGKNITEIQKLTYYDSGLYSCVSETENQKLYTYRGDKRYFRFETTLSNGYLLVDDGKGPESAEYIYCSKFDINTKIPSRKLNDNAVMKLQRNNESWYKVIYQINGVDKILVASQKYCGLELISEEFYIGSNGK